MQRSLLAGLAALCFLAFPSRLAADSMTQIVGFASTPNGFIGLQPFDPSLGTLTSVNVTIQGQLSGNFVTFPNTCPPGVPCPAPYNAGIDQNFFGLLGKYFTFSSNAEFLFTGSATGAGETIPLIETYTYNFKFDSFTDLVGFTLMNPTFSGNASTFLPPIQINGTLSGFEKTILPINEVDEVVSAGPTTGGFLTNWHDAGAITIIYNFTPASAVPEPASMLLLGSGLSAVIVRSRLRRKHRQN